MTFAIAAGCGWTKGWENAFRHIDVEKMGRLISRPDDDVSVRFETLEHLGNLLIMGNF